MKQITVKVITISSQILVVCLFLCILFNVEENNEKAFVVYNSNFNKMADRTITLFKEEELIINQIDENVVVELEDNTQIVDTIVEEENIIIEEEKEAELQVEEVKNESPVISELETVIETYDNGILTGYGPDCIGCGNPSTGKVLTSSGYHIANFNNGSIGRAFTITYNDDEYGEVRIVAADANIPYYSIVRITVPNWDSPILAIVLDRGSTVGFENCRSDRGCLTNFDLLYPTENESLGKTLNVKFELLRSGK